MSSVISLHKYRNATQLNYNKIYINVYLCAYYTHLFCERYNRFKKYKRILHTICLFLDYLQRWSIQGLYTDDILWNNVQLIVFLFQFTNHFKHLLWKVSIVWAFLTSSGKLFQTRQPEYLKLCLKHSVLGLGGIKQPAEDDLKLILVFTLFRIVKFSEI